MAQLAHRQMKALQPNPQIVKHLLIAMLQVQELPLSYPQLQRGHLHHLYLPGKSFKTRVLRDLKLIITVKFLGHHQVHHLHFLVVPLVGLHHRYPNGSEAPRSVTKEEVSLNLHSFHQYLFFLPSISYHSMELFFVGKDALSLVQCKETG